MALFGKKRAAGDQKRTLGKGVFRRCEACGETRVADDFIQNLEVCPSCKHHHRLSGEAWLELLLDADSWLEADATLESVDALAFRDTRRYPDRIESAQARTGVRDALMSGSGRMAGRELEIAVFLFRFLGGSMGSVVGEKLARTFERGAMRGRPVVVLSASGGARMQEGILSLMQMAKTVAALGRLREAGMPFISILLNPTTGGVAASYALLGDVNIAEPQALIGFAGPRVIESTIRETLPEGFQRAEYLLEHGMLDIIAERRDLRATVARVLGHLVG